MDISLESFTLMLNPLSKARMNSLTRLALALCGYLCLLCESALGQLDGQGFIDFIVGGDASTRMYTRDGAFAGPDIWGQLLVGVSPSDLTPVGVPVRHQSEGGIDGASVLVPSPPFPRASFWGYVQMVAWDDRLWGGSLENVPADQLGHTDVVPILVAELPQPENSPEFTQPAIVPIPEPAISMLGVLACLLVFLLRRGNSTV